MKANEIGMSPQTYAGEKGNLIKGKDFIKLFNQALGKSSVDIGWEDRVEEIPIPNTGYKNLDKNSDGKVDIDDIKTISPDKANDLLKVNDSIGKKEGDSGWEDERKVILGYKNADVSGNGMVNWYDLWLVYKNFKMGDYNPRYDVNKDGRIDQKDTNEVKKARGKRNSQPGWEDRIELIKEGAKRQDFNQDKKIDKEDLFAILKDLKEIQLLKEAYGKKVGDIGWEDKTKQEIIPNTGYKNFDLTGDGRVTEDDLAFYFKGLFPTGSLIKTENTFYLIQEGRKRLIGKEDRLTRLNITSPVTASLSKEEAELIPSRTSLIIMKKEDGSINPDFFSYALGKTKDSLGWEDASYLRMGAKNGDFNDDGQINLYDFMAFRNAYNTNPTRYDLDKDGLVDMKDFAIFRGFYGKMAGDEGWEDKIMAILKTGYKNLDLKEDNRINSEDLEGYFSQAYGEDVLIKEEQGETYLLQKGRKIQLADQETREVMGIDYREVKVIGKDEFNLIPDGGSIKLYRDGTLIKDADNYYLILDGNKRRFLSSASVRRHGFSPEKAIPASIDHIQQGEDMPEYPDGMLIKDSDGSWNPFIEYSIIENGKRRKIDGGIYGVQNMGLGDKKK